MRMLPRSNPLSDEQRRLLFLRILQLKLELPLGDIEGILGEDFKLTLVARYTGSDHKDADIVLTVDDLDLAIAAIEKMKHRTPVCQPS